MLRACRRLDQHFKGPRKEAGENELATRGAVRAKARVSSVLLILYIQVRGRFSVGMCDFWTLALLFIYRCGLNPQTKKALFLGYSFGTSLVVAPEERSNKLRSPQSSSHSQTSRLLTSSLSLGLPVPRPTQCV